MVADAKETLGFQAEITQLMDLMVHSLYSNKEIFLRELISNGSDAIDRLRFAALADPALLAGDGEYAIHVSFDKAARTITITDNGIGMARAEVVEHIGTIAKSGTREFLQSLTGDQQKDANLIGQFGVGFYSAFVVAERIDLLTRHAGLAADEAVLWESDGRGTYTIGPAEKPERGTAITLHLREGEDELLDGYRLRQIIRKYSDHISVPILMPHEGKDATGEGQDAPGEEQVNRAAALWSRTKSEITTEEYTEFYKHIAHDYEGPLTWVHSRMEGTSEYTLLLFVPKHAPFDLWNRDQQHGVKLYVRRIFIMDDAEQLLPRYLRFVRGVVDSSDLPLNVSREILQHNRVIETIKAQSIKKILGALSDLAANQPEEYATFWTEFGKAFKEGLIEDHTNREALAKLLRFASTKSEGKQDVGLEAYVARMPEGQDKIYYLVAESFDAAKDSPLLEIFRQKGVEALLLTDPVDTMLEAELPDFNGIHLQSVARGEIDLDKLANQQPTPEDEQPAVSEVDDLLKRLKDALGEHVKAVRMTSRLTTSPACLVVDEQDLDPTLRRLLQATGQKLPNAQQILEINPRHPVIARISRETDAARFADWATVLFDQSILSRGEQLDQPARFVHKLNELLASL